ncbi:MAG: ABC transporter ATP-binding protein, partial [Thermoprotei archaeon]
MYSIEVEELYKSYDKTPFKKKVINILKFKSPESERVEALKGISFKVRKGEVFGFLGPNGAGKTTTVKILTTILKPDSGYASILGFDVVKESLEVRKRIGVLPEESSRGFYWRLTVYESLYFYALEYGVDDPKKRVKEVIEMVGLGEAAYDRWFQRLSQGMKQKAALARALVPDAPVMFLDEP